MAGLINVGRQTLGQATQGFGAASQLEQSRNAMGRQLDAARNAQRVSMTTTGAGLGASIGVNNLMANQAAAKAAEEAAKQAALKTAVSAPAATSAPAASWTIPVGGGPMPIAGADAVAANVVGDVMLEQGAEMLAEEAAKQALAEGTKQAGAQTLGATIGAIATPLLIGAAGALLLDSLFDIF